MPDGVQQSLLQHLARRVRRKPELEEAGLSGRKAVHGLVHPQDLEPLAEVGHRIGWESGSSGHEDHEEDFVFLAHLLKDVPQPDNGHVAWIQIPETCLNEK